MKWLDFRAERCDRRPSVSYFQRPSLSILRPIKTCPESHSLPTETLLSLRPPAVMKLAVYAIRANEELGWMMYTKRLARLSCRATCAEQKWAGGGKTGVCVFWRKLMKGYGTFGKSQSQHTKSLSQPLICTFDRKSRLDPCCSANFNRELVSD